MTVDSRGAGAFFYVLQERVRILFVDDDPILREFALVNLTTEQASVEAAPDGVAALAAMRIGAPDIVLLDLEMPHMDGFEVLRQMRADPAWRDLPVIVITGREDVDAVDRAFQAGATSFVVKPLNWRLLSYQIRYVQRAARAAAQAAEATAQLERLARESSRFLSVALSQNAALRPAAVDFAKVADQVLSAARAEQAA